MNESGTGYAHLGFFEKLSIASFIAFLVSQTFKTLVPEYLGISADATVLTALICMVSFVLSMVGRNPFRRWQLPVLGFVALYLFMMPLVSLTYADFGKEYTSYKATGVFTLTLFATAMPVFLVVDPRRLRFFLKAFFWIATLAVGAAELDAISKGALDQLNFRVEGFGANVILLSRVAAGCVLLAFLQLRARDPIINRSVSITVMCLLVVAALITASRGPFYGMILVMLLFANTNDESSSSLSTRLLVLVVVGSAVAFLLPWATQFLPEPSAQKITDASSGVRADMWIEAVRIIIANPSGIGFAEYSSYTSEVAYLGHDYVHNLVLEYFMETGYLGGMLLLGMMLHLLWMHRPSLDFSDNYTQVHLLMMYFFLQALLSADMNGNRLFFAFAAICLLKPYIFGQAGQLAAPAASPAGGRTGDQPTDQTTDQTGAHTGEQAGERADNSVAGALSANLRPQR